jgi:uncharacterized protein YjiS (DUF1127 family)
VVCQINCREQSGTLSVAAQGSFKEISVMMEQSLNGMFRPSSLDATVRRTPTSVAGCAAHKTVVPSRRDKPYRAADGNPADSRGHRTVARPRRSRQKLRELSEHLLKDIGLRREDVGYEFQKPFWHCD